MTQKTNTVSGKYADATQNNLFKPNNFEHGVDLLSINLAVSFSDQSLYDDPFAMTTKSKLTPKFSVDVNMVLVHIKLSGIFAWTILN